MEARRVVVGEEHAVLDCLRTFSWTAPAIAESLPTAPARTVLQIHIKLSKNERQQALGPIQQRIDWYATISVDTRLSAVTLLRLVGGQW